MSLASFTIFTSAAQNFHAACRRKGFSQLYPLTHHELQALDIDALQSKVARQHSQKHFSLFVSFGKLLRKSECRVRECTQHRFCALTEKAENPKGKKKIDKDGQSRRGRLRGVLRSVGSSTAASRSEQSGVGDRMLHCVLSVEAVVLSSGLLVRTRRSCARRMVRSVEISLAGIHADTQHRGRVATYRQSAYCRCQCTVCARSVEGV